MGRYSSLCVFLTLTALVVNITPSSGSGQGSSGAGGSSSGGGGFGARISESISKLGDHYRSVVTSTFTDVVYSDADNEKGILKMEVKQEAQGERFWYKFYADRSLARKGDISGVKPTVQFPRNGITSVTPKGNVVQFKQGTDKVYSLKFKNANDANAFVYQQAQLGY